MESSHPDLEQARQFAAAIHNQFPGKLLAYSCSPSFNWAAKLSRAQMETFREELAALGYRLQFITLAGFALVGSTKEAQFQTTDLTD